ncbi:MAG: DUF922 domain-containing protein [Sphingomicrobium sp.]
MLSLMTALAVGLAAQVAVPPAQTRTLENLPGVKLHPYVVTGQSSDAIQNSMKAALKAQPKTIGQLFTWTASIHASQDTLGTVCTIKDATAALDANVYLPQLTDEAKIPADDLRKWKPYQTGLRQQASDNLWFVADRLPTVARSLVGKPCDQAAAVWNAGITGLIAQQQAFDKQNQKKAAGKS